MTKFTVYFKGNSPVISGTTYFPKKEAQQELAKALKTEKVICVNDETVIMSDAIAFIVLEEEESDDGQA